ncbi:hypothetical protein [Nocardiopsis composta]|uniref:Uncharacterized protein n=1 Tax=Nocardiopsis composta TaxID=157465 RepID=A0A7W8QRZ9_9ACTN|nr:hypothetical protein [Nocardiopsis composta]MBB5434526.1 hypothetical protein [Nocardiopsis composta]
MNTVLLLAQTEIDQDTITPGLLGFLAIAFIGAVLYFLMKSMRTKLDNVRSGALAESAPAEGAPAGERAERTDD